MDEVNADNHEESENSLNSSAEGSSIWFLPERVCTVQLAGSVARGPMDPWLRGPVAPWPRLYDIVLRSLPVPWPVGPLLVGPLLRGPWAWGRGPVARGPVARGPVARGPVPSEFL